MRGVRARIAFLALADILCLAGVWAFVVWGYRAIGLGDYEFGADFYLRLWPVGVAYVVINAMFRLYHGNFWYPAAPLSPVEELRRLVGSSLIVHLGLVAFIGLAHKTTQNYSRAVILISGVLTAVLSQPARDLLRAALHALRIGQIPVVFVGHGAYAERVLRSLSRDAYTGFTVVKRFGFDSPDIVPAARRLGVRVLVACQDIRLFRLKMSEYSGHFSHIEYIAGGDIFPTFGAQTVSFDGAGGLEMVNQRCLRAIRAEKMVFDKLLAVAAFLMLLPFFVVVPVLVKLTSRGPVFYRQRRLGKMGRPIRVWKFRSMYTDADERLKEILANDPVRRTEWESNFKLTDDPRVTPLGRFLRKTSIDEFPQLFNVFAGDMALVGPRPIVEAEVKYYGGAYETFASVRPGITGLWQASGRSDTDYGRRVALDIQYVLNWSPWMDIWILFRTVYAVVFMRGAR